MTEPISYNCHIPLFVRDCHKEIMHNLISDISFAEAINDGSIRVYDNSNCMPVDTVGPLTKIRFKDSLENDYIEFNVYDTLSGRCLKAWLDMNCPMYAVPVFSLDRYKGVAKDLIGFLVKPANTDIHVDDEFDNFIATQVIRENNIFEYKGYQAIIEFSSKDSALYGKVLNTNDKILFEIEDPKSAFEVFKATIDEYLEFCEEEGKTPD